MNKIIGLLLYGILFSSFNTASGQQRQLNNYWTLIDENPIALQTAGTTESYNAVHKAWYSPLTQKISKKSNIIN